MREKAEIQAHFTIPGFESLSLRLLCVIFMADEYRIHYYPCIISAAARLPEDSASKIAVSSQMVDENLAAWEIRGGDKTSLSIVTQNYQFWDETTARSIYRPFHFLPGEKAKADSYRRDGRAGKYPVTADSPLAREILIAALRSGNPTESA